MTKIKTRAVAIIVLVLMLVSSLIIGVVTVSNRKEEKTEGKILFEYNSGGAIAVCDDVEDLPSETLSEETEYSMQILFDYEPYSDAIYEENHEGKETFVEYSKKYHTQNNQYFLKKMNTKNYEVFVSEYTPYVFFTCVEESTTSDLYDQAVDIAKHDFVNTVRIYPSDICRQIANSSTRNKGNSQVEEAGAEDLATIAEEHSVRSPSENAPDCENYPANTTYTGRGIKIGILDAGKFNRSHSNFSNTSTKIVLDDYTANDTGDDADHPTMVASVLGGRYGYAPGASLYYVDFCSNLDTSLTGIERLINEGCHIVNMSFSIYGATDSTYDTGLEGYLDYIYTSTKIIMVAATGNELDDDDCAGYINIPAMCANVISVGSVLDTERPYPSEFSSYKNKNDVSSNPNLVAVGTSRYIETFGLCEGTSFSAPAVTGAIALHFEKYGVQELPEILAVLSASANRNVHTGTLDGHTNNLKSNGSRERTGAGVLDVTTLLYCNNFVYYDEVTFTSDNYVTVANVYIGAGHTAQIALAWERAATRTVEGALWWQTETYSSNTLADFDLYLFDSNGTSVGIGWSSSSNVEIVEYTATTSGFYTVKIKPDSNYANTHNINCISVVK